MKSRIITISVVLVVIAAIVMTLMKNKKEIDAKNKVVDKSSIPTAVAAIPIKRGDLSGNLILPAVLTPKDEAIISATTSGKLESFKIELGSVLRKGQSIGSVDTKVKQIDVRAKELTVQKLKKDYERYVELFKGNAVQETAMLDAKYNYESNQIQLDQLRQQIADAQLIAPVSGKVVSKDKVQGEYVTAGMQVAKVVDLSQLKTVVYVNEKNVYQLTLNQRAEITSDVLPGKIFQGKIAYISPAGDENHNYRVEVLLDSKATNALKAGTYVRVDFNLNQTGSVLQLPKKALVGGVNQPYVYLVNGNRAVKQKVVLGRELGEYFEIVAGLNEGDVVVTDGQVNITDGSLIETTIK